MHGIGSWTSRFFIYVYGCSWEYTGHIFQQFTICCLAISGVFNDAKEIRFWLVALGKLPIRFAVDKQLPPHLPCSLRPCHHPISLLVPLSVMRKVYRLIYFISFFFTLLSSFLPLLPIKNTFGCLLKILFFPLWFCWIPNINIRVKVRILLLFRSWSRRQALISIKL